MDYLSLKQIEKYHRDGFLTVKSVFSRKECGELKIELLKEINKGEKILKKSSTKAIKEVDYNKLADIPRLINDGFLQDIAHRNSKFMALAKEKRLINIISKLFRKDVKAYRLYRSLSVFKNSKVILKSALHQDMLYWKGGMNKLSVWIALDETTKQSGALIFIPGSHNKIQKHSFDGRKGKKAINISIQNIDDSQKIISEVNVGDIIIFHSCVIHGSEENILGNERYSLTFSYQPASDKSHHRYGPSTLIE